MAWPGGNGAMGPGGMAPGAGCGRGPGGMGARDGWYGACGGGGGPRALRTPRAPEGRW